MASSRTREALCNDEGRQGREGDTGRKYLRVFLPFLRGMGTNTQSQIAPTHSNNHTLDD
jgi:hypothetical protein